MSGHRLATDRSPVPGPSPRRLYFREFLRHEVAGSFVLLAATVLALVLANSPANEQVDAFWKTEVGFAFGDYHFEQSLLHWIDDGLMALFFLVIGLEIKREVLVGELATPRKAALPVIAAAGGMVAPAMVYLALNAGTESAAGWGIPMATDIAFALGVLAMLGPRVPAGIKVFLAALAIADDIGAILVIALFYAGGLSGGWLAAAAAGFVVLAVLNRARVDVTWPYLLVGLGVWFAFLNSGVHATIAGVLVAFFIPAGARVEPVEFATWTRERLGEIEAHDVPGAHVLADDTQQLLAREISEAARYVQAPLQRIEQTLVPWVTYGIIPLFALANAGVRLSGAGFGDVLTSRVALGVFLGLLVGKQVGVLGASWLAVRLGISDLPQGVSWRHIHGAGVLAGIGFTMSIFITVLAFDDPELVAQAKVAVLVTSVLAGTAGYSYLRLGQRGSSRAAAAGTSSGERRDWEG